MKLGTLQPATAWSRVFSIMVLAMMFVVLTPRAPSVLGTPHAQPALLELAAQRPNARVSIIVQKLAQDTSVEETVRQFQGQVTQDLQIINAFAAELPARAIPFLARLPGVRWISLDVPVVESVCSQCIDTSKLKSAYISAIGADQIWNTAPYRQGQGIGVAVVDSGIQPQEDLYTMQGQSRVIKAVRFNSGYNTSTFDGYGHGNHVAGIIGSNGRASAGGYIGVAPLVNLINVKVSNDQGQASTSNVVAGLQWINNNRNTYNIRVVNISLNSSAPESYHTSPLAAAVEILWINKIVVVVSAGNQGHNALYPPANDPFVITVGATDDRGTTNRSDDVMASFSAYGTTTDGFAKPDLVAPGTNLVSLMANANSALAVAHPSHVLNQTYMRMSGTSMAAPVVAGTVALLLQDEPTLTPDQVKYRLKATARPFDSTTRAGAGYLDAYAAVTGTTTQSANTGSPISQLLWKNTGAGAGSSVNWNSVNWNSVTWGSVNWNSVTWGSVNWNSVNWNSAIWSSDSWDN